MVVALLVVEDDLALDGLLGRLLGDQDLALRIDGRKGLDRGLDGQLERVEQASGIAASHFDQVLQGPFLERDVILSVSPFRVVERLLRDFEEVVAGQSLELEDPRAADKRGVDLEEGILGGGRVDEDRAVLHPGEQRVLLALVPAVHLVDEQDRPLPVVLHALPCQLDFLA